MTRRYAVCLLLSLFAAGCGSGDDLMHVTGTATRNGRPVPNLGITFSPENGMRSTGLTDKDGHFTLLYSKGGQAGVLVGKHKVSVQLPPLVGAKDDPEKQKLLTEQKKDPEIAKILEKYGNSETTTLILEITASKEIELPLD